MEAIRQHATLILVSQISCNITPSGSKTARQAIKKVAENVRAALGVERADGLADSLVEGDDRLGRRMTAGARSYAKFA